MLFETINLAPSTRYISDEMERDPVSLAIWKDCQETGKYGWVGIYGACGSGNPSALPSFVQRFEAIST